MERADVIVIGLGAMGSAASWQLARRGLDVIGIDRRRPPHEHGSTLGESRVTRVATAEGAEYVPLAARSHELWREIEAETGTDIFTACGMVMVGAAVGGGTGLHGLDDWLGRTYALAQQFDIAHELLDGAAAAARWPALGIASEHRVYVEPGAGFLRPEIAVRAQLDLAERAGARLLLDTTVTDIEPDGDGVAVATSAGTLHAAHAIVSAGAGIVDLLDAPELRSLFEVERQLLRWYELDPAHAADAGPDQLPVYFWATGDEPFYGFPSLDGRTIKAATDEVEPDDGERFHERRLRGRLLAATSIQRRSAPCLYTVTPDRGFVIDAHPALDNVTLVSPCSGHGFKHSAAIGEALAQRIVDGGSRIDLAPFGLGRFGP
jgi:sarcosine oxidase